MCFIIKYGGITFIAPSRHWCRATSLWRTAEGQFQSLGSFRSKSEAQSLEDWVASLYSKFSSHDLSSVWLSRRLVLPESCDLLSLCASTQPLFSPIALCGTKLSFKSLSIFSGGLFWCAALWDDGSGKSPPTSSSFLCTLELKVPPEVQLKWLWSSPWGSTGWWFVPQQISISSCSSVGWSSVSWDTSLSWFWCSSWTGRSADGAPPEAWPWSRRVGRMAWWHMGHVSCTYNHLRRQLPWKKCPQYVITAEPMSCERRHVWSFKIKA